MIRLYFKRYLTVENRNMDLQEPLIKYAKDLKNNEDAVRVSRVSKGARLRNSSWATR
jgi:hypothetical protein